MPKSSILDPDGSIDDLTDEELLGRIAGLDPDEYPLAHVAERALAREIQDGEDGDS